MRHRVIFILCDEYAGGEVVVNIIGNTRDLEADSFDINVIFAYLDVSVGLFHMEREAEKDLSRLVGELTLKAEINVFYGLHKDTLIS
jgi:hypothetical protein